jgi:replication factor C subunit 2/4
MESLPWIEKYRPKKLEDMAQEEGLISLLKNAIDTGDIPHFLFYGPPGTGKTSSILAMGREIFKEYFPDRVVEFNASDDRGINAVREKITHDAKLYVTDTVSADGTKIPPYKIIILDEADSMTDEAQNALRVIIEEYSTVTRFCFICNYISKITSAIKSRCSAVYFKRLNNDCMLEKLNQIALKEKMHLTEEVLNTIIEVSNGDMRSAIMTLQNIKYLYEFKKVLNTNFDEMSMKDLKLIAQVHASTNTDSEITPEDIYQISACINMKKANHIIKSTLKCNSLIEISKLTRHVIAMGYPIDSVMSQINQACMESGKFTDTQKAQIITYSGRIFLKMKECSNEYLQLLDYLACIYGVNKTLPTYLTAVA